MDPNVPKPGTILHINLLAGYRDVTALLVNLYEETDDFYNCTLAFRGNSPNNPGPVKYAVLRWSREGQIFSLGEDNVVTVVGSIRERRNMYTIEGMGDEPIHLTFHQMAGIRTVLDTNVSITLYMPYYRPVEITDPNRGYFCGFVSEYERPEEILLQRYNEGIRARYACVIFMGGEPFIYKFDNLEFLQGVSTALQWQDLNPESIITYVMENGQFVDVDY